MAIEKELLDQLLDGRDPETAFTQDGLLDQLKKGLSERVLNAALDAHLDAETADGKTNRHNGRSQKTVLTGTSKVTLDIPRDRAGTFDPQLIAKYQRRFPDFDEKIISMYACGLASEIFLSNLSLELNTVGSVLGHGFHPLKAQRSRSIDGMDAPYHGVTCARMEFGFELQTEGASTMDITTIGFDLAKTVFQVHGADGEGRAVLRRKLRRGKVLAFFAGLPSCLVGMEACASAHYWAREIQALGHEVRLIPPQYVRPFVKTNKNDAADAEAICEAVTRPAMRFASAKSAEQQSVLMLHRARELLVRQRTMVINALRGHCAELGLIVAQGASKVEELVAIIEDPGDVRLPPLAREALGSLVEQLHSAQARIKQLEATLLAWHRSNQASRRLATIPGVGVITATALVATIGDGAQFRSGRQLSAWLGLVPRQHSSGGKDRLGRISKRGDGYIRRLLVHGARSVLRWRRAKPGTGPGWTDRLLARRPTNVVLVAMANKTARVAWALLRYERIYRPTPA